MKMKKMCTFLSIILILFIYRMHYINSISYKTWFDYNFLNNNQIVNYTKSILLKNNIAKENINIWSSYVKKYNLHNPNFIKNTCTGWNKIRLSNYSKIDFKELLNGWTDEADAVDLNCRISSFILIKDNISSDYFTRKSDSFINKEIIKMNSYFGECFTNKDATTYSSLYTPIELSIDDSKSINVYDETLKTLNNNWKNENLIFKNDNVKLIQVIFIESIDKCNIQATTGHVGLLIKDNSMLYFIEKKNPCFPYQISKFKTYNELNQYIFSQFKEFKNNKLMILQNGDMIFKQDI